MKQPNNPVIKNRKRSAQLKNCHSFLLFEKLRMIRIPQQTIKRKIGVSLKLPVPGIPLGRYSTAVLITRGFPSREEWAIPFMRKSGRNIIFVSFILLSMRFPNKRLIPSFSQGFSTRYWLMIRRKEIASPGSTLEVLHRLPKVLEKISRIRVEQLSNTKSYL